MENKKLVLIENIFQAKEYLKNRKRLGNCIPITFTFAPEEFLLKNKIKFKTEDDFEDDKIYRGIYPSSVKSAKKIIQKLSVWYKDVELVSLYYLNILCVIASLKKYNRLLKRIINEERPDEIVVFENKNSSNKDYIPKITSNIFKGKIKVCEYNNAKIRKDYFFSTFGIIQKIYSKIKLNMFKNSGRKIFFCGNKSAFENIIKSSDKKNAWFRVYKNLQKSFIVNRKYIPFYEFPIKTSLSKELENEILRLKEKINQLDIPKEFEIEKELGKSLKSKLDNFIGSVPEMASLINKMYILIKEKKINLLFLDNSVGPFERAFIEVCKISKIPSVIMQHGAIGLKEGFIPMGADFILVWGNSSKEWFLKNGVSRDKIKVTGYPKYDSYIKKNSKEKIVLYLADAVNQEGAIPDIQLTKKRQKEVLKSVLRVLKKFPEYKLIIKTRIGWEMNNLPRTISKQENFKNIKIIESTDNLKLLNSAEIVIISHTTMGLEAILLDKPVISFSYKDLDKSNIYTNKKIVKMVYSEKELEQAIKNSKSNDRNYPNQREKLLKQEFVSLDNKSSERVINFIDKLLN